MLEGEKITFGAKNRSLDQSMKKQTKCCSDGKNLFDSASKCAALVLPKCSFLMVLSVN